MGSKASLLTYRSCQQYLTPGFGDSPQIGQVCCRVQESVFVRGLAEVPSSHPSRVIDIPDPLALADLSLQS
jgi:hypothetical protein